MVSICSSLLCLLAIVELTRLGWKPAVALGGMDCETVVDAATDAAEEVLCALATASRTEPARTDRENIVTVFGGDVMLWDRRCFDRREVVCEEKLCQLMLEWLSDVGREKRIWEEK